MKKLNEETQKTIKSRKRWILILCIVLPLIAVFKFAAIGFAEPVPDGARKQVMLYQASGATTEGTSDSGVVSPSGNTVEPVTNEDVANRPGSMAGELIMTINYMWSTVGQVIRNFAADNSMLIGFSTSEMENFAENMAFIFQTVGYFIIILVFSLNIIEYGLKFEYYDKKMYFKTLGYIFLGKCWVDLSIKIVLLIFRIFNSIAYVISDPATMELLPQYTPEKAWYSYIPIIGVLIDLVVAIFELIPLFLTLIVVSIVIICIFVKLTIRCFEMTCLITVAPAFMACFAGDITKKYGQRYIETVISIGLDLVFIAVVYTIGLQWLNKLAAENSGGFMEFGEYVTRMVLIVAMGVVICKPPKVLTGLVG